MQLTKVFFSIISIILIKKKYFKKFEGDYPEWKMIRTQSFKPDKVHQANFHFDDESTYSSDFVSINQAPRSIIKPDKSILKSVEPFSSKTGYREDYANNNTNNGSDKLRRESRISFKPDATVYSIPNSNGFYDPYTRSNESFKWQIQPIENNRKEIKSMHNFDHSKQTLPRIERKKSDDKFESDPTYSLDYKDKSVDKKNYTNKKNKFSYYW